MKNKGAAFKVYQASAGSGKTYTIVKEHLKICLGKESDTDNFKSILAITFTNKAANEMKAKIISQLLSISNSDSTQPAKGMEEELLQQLKISRNDLKTNAKRLFENIIHDYSSFNVCTIDAFVQKLSRSFAKDLNLPYQYNVSIDDDEIATEITQRIGAQLGKDHQFLTNVLCDFVKLRIEDDRSGLVQNDLHSFVISLLKESAYEKESTSSPLIEAEYKKALDFIKGSIHNFKKNVADFITKYKSLTKKFGLRQEHFYYKSKGLPGFVNKLEKNTFETPNSYVNKFIEEKIWYHKDAKNNLENFEQIDHEMNLLLGEFLDIYIEKLPNYLFLSQQKPLLCLYVLRSKLKSELEDFIKEEQLVHISEFNKRISDVMGDFSVPFVYERIGERFKHVFIDEFQDTSILQWQNLIPLVDNSLSNNAMSMVVGDGKQSIYRFRSGEVEQLVELPEIYGKPHNSKAFDVFENNFKNHFEFTNLGTNYRSFRNIVIFNNHFFENVVKRLPASIRKVYLDKNEKFGKEVSIKQEPHHKEEGLVQVELYEKTMKKDEVILERIKSLIEECLASGFSHGDITILVRDNKKGSIIANYLNNNNIPVVSSDSILLQSSDRVALILSTLNYLINNDNKVVISDIIHKWHTTCEKRDYEPIQDLFNDVNDIAAHKKDIEEKLGEEKLGLKEGDLRNLISKSYSLYDLCAALIRAYGFDGTQDPYLNHLLEEVHKWQSSNELGIGAFLDYWEKKKDCLAVRSSENNAVNIMTIHKSKGLEFNVVIYPFAYNNLAERFGRVVWERPEMFGMEAVPNIEKVSIRISPKISEWNDESKSYYEKEKNDAILDDLNIMYVAFTRAVQRLYVLTRMTESEGEPEKQIIEKALEGYEKNIIEKECSPEHTVYRFGDAKKKVKESGNVKSIKKMEMSETRSSGWLEKIQIDPKPSVFWASENETMQPQEWGDLIHEILSGIRTLDDMDQALKPFLDDGQIDAETSEKLKLRFKEIANHPRIEKAFRKDALVKNECEILSPTFGIIRPDRYAEVDDQIILLDYKTGKKSQEHHRQLNNYAAVLKEMVKNKEIRAFLVYISDAVEVEPVELKN